jgi:hypothetical protein
MSLIDLTLTLRDGALIIVKEKLFCEGKLKLTFKDFH